MNSVSAQRALRWTQRMNANQCTKTQVDSTMAREVARINGAVSTLVDGVFDQFLSEQGDKGHTWQAKFSWHRWRNPAGAWLPVNLPFTRGFMQTFSNVTSVMVGWDSKKFRGAVIKKTIRGA